MNRSKMTELEMQEAFQPQENHLTKPKQYNEISNALKKESLARDIDNTLALLEDASTRARINLRDVDAVRTQASRYLQVCSQNRAVPTFMAMCVSFGMSRQNVYQWMKANPNHETTRFLQTLQTAFASILSSQALQRNFSEAVSIFLLKNSGCGLTDTASFELIQHDPMEDCRTAEEIASKYRDIAEEE